MPALPRDLGLEEYRALRATIRERGSLRLSVILLTFVAWAALALAATAASRFPGLTLVPLIVLAAGFEVILAAHVGVERIGRYVQARYERALDDHDGSQAWEHVAMTLGGSRARGAGVDPLAGRLFMAATIVNMLPAGLWLLAGRSNQWVLVTSALEASCHLAFLVRVTRARRFAAVQRQADLESIQAVLQARQPK